MLKNNKAFTLVELVVAFTLTTLVITWMTYFFSSVVDWTTALSVSSNLFSWTDNIDNLITEYQKNYKYFQKNTETNFDFKKWFDILLLEDDEITPTKWVLFWVYNNTDEEIIIWDIINYKDYKLFYKELDNAEVASARSNLKWFTTALTKDNINIINDLNLIKFWVSNLEWKIKLDFRLTPIYYDNLEWYNLDIFEKNQNAESYYITLLK